jgi:alpha-glucosidase (family GH31 glycosyl hydrolase)
MAATKNNSRPHTQAQGDAAGCRTQQASHLMDTTLIIALVASASATRGPGYDKGTPPKFAPALLDYTPVAEPKAVVTASDGWARFTVLTPRLVRMEYAFVKERFEERATLAVLNRALPVPNFTSSEVGGVLSIVTSEVKLTYKVGSGSFEKALSVAPVNPLSSFPGWTFGDASPGNLLGTIRGLDQQLGTSLNCTENSLVLDNGEYNHCEFGLVSRDGWAVYEDQRNAALDKDYWWDTTGLPQPPQLCTATVPQTDVSGGVRANNFQAGTNATDVGACCAKCKGEPSCTAYIWDSNAGDTPNCWPLAAYSAQISDSSTQSRVLGRMAPGPLGPQFNVDRYDLYGFFHGLDFRGAVADYSKIGGKTAMVLRAASGVWWSRWFDLNNADTRGVIEDYESRDIPVSVYVLDMNWHAKNDWSGFTFDTHLYPYPADTMEYVRQQGLPVTMNLHDASGVNNWEGKFPQLVKALGLPPNSTKVPFNLVNATVAYAVEDIVLGDLIENKSVNFWWIDWQQGGSQGGMTGFKQNPTIWTAHLRCTDHLRNGDKRRGMVLARWGGMGHHRYQVGFSGDVRGLTWDNLAYQPYFSATAANVLFPFWSHDIEGDSGDLEMYVRWVQFGSYSGVMRSHDRGMAGGGCSSHASHVPPASTGWGPETGDCSVVQPWQTGPLYFPPIRAALRAREALVPYIYNTHRTAYESGIGLIVPMYYDSPTNPHAYRMNATHNAQYMFGPSMLVSPIVTPARGGASDHLVTKTTWLPDGDWYSAVSGRVDVAKGGATFIEGNYTLGEVPLWVKAGAVVPYVPLRSLPSIVGVAGKQYTYLGWRIYPGALNGEGYAYEDDGETTAYLDGAFVNTTCKYTTHADGGMEITISSSGAGYPEWPSGAHERVHQIRLLNRPPPTSIKFGGVQVPFSRFGALASKRVKPASSAWYYDTTVGEGVGVVIDLVSSTSWVLNGDAVVISLAPSATGLSTAEIGGFSGAVTRAGLAKHNLDLDRTTPGSNTVQPAYTSVLSSQGEALAYLAGGKGADPVAFAAAVRSVPELLLNASAEVAKDDHASPRTPYSLALLACKF